MKITKVLIMLGMTLPVSGMFAQGGSSTTTTSTTTTSSTPVITDKKGEMFLPQAGDWALTMDATPWLNYFGNFFHGNNATAAPTTAFANGTQTIMGKYFVNANTAYRALLRIGINSTTTNSEINSSSTNDTDFPAPQVEDKQTVSTHFVGIGAGIEKRRGSTRLQGYYGAELMFFLSGSTTTTTYGNAYSATTDPDPTWTNNFNTYATSTGLGAPGISQSGGRPTQIETGSTFGIGLTGFIGVEYFILPKISIGGEFTWGLTYQTTGQGSMSVEELSKTSADVVDTYKTPGGGSSFSLDNALGMNGGNLYINFHF